MNSSFFGWQIVCGWSTCGGPSNPAAWIDVYEVKLTVRENTGPWIIATSPLYYERGWIRGGGWPLTFSTDDPSGVCHVEAVIGTTVLPGPSSNQDHTVWHQCSVTGFSQTVNTTDYPDGPLTIGLIASNAAGDVSWPSTTVQVDNQPVAVTLSGPTDVPSTAGTQYITATGTAGPSGVSGLGCSLDGAAYQWYPQASVQIPVAGVGVHQLTCYSANTAVDASGNVATSVPETWTLSVRQPTVSGIGFSRLVDPLRCRRVTERVKLPAGWVTVRRHHRLVRVHERARTKLVRVTRCSPRIERRKIAVWVTVRRHGKKVLVKREQTIRVVVPPHVVTNSSRWVGHGRPTTVNGWLGMSDGTALAGQTVRVLSAPDNGLGQFTQAALVTTGADGSWTAQLPPGPSRLVEAVYDGTSTLEPAVSGQAHVIVPAKVKLISVSPRRVAWGGTLHIVGQLEGGYLPPGGALVRLRIGEGSSYTTYGVQEHVTGNGRFSTTYTFGDGLPSVHRAFWFQIASLPMGGDYPWAPSDSRRLTVIVGGHPAIICCRSR